MSTEKIHLRGRAALIAAVSHSFGFVPSDSLVVVSLCGAGNIMGPTMRVDLPTAGQPMVVPAAICRVVSQYADAIVVIVFCKNSLRSRGHATSAAEMLEVLIEVRDVLYVTGTRVGSYRDGTVEPWSMQDAPDHLLITGGRTVLASRQALCDLLDPAAVGQSVGAGQLDDATEEMQRLEPAALARVADRLYRQAVTRAGRGRALPDDLGADLLVALSALPIRDGVLCSAVADVAAGQSSEVLAALTMLVGRAPDAWAADPAAVLAAAAYRSGEGALAGAALDRALSVRPGHRLATLLLGVVQEGLPPNALDSLMPSALPSS